MNSPKPDDYMPLSSYEKMGKPRDPSELRSLSSRRFFSSSVFELRTWVPTPTRNPPSQSSDSSSLAEAGDKRAAVLRCGCRWTGGESDPVGVDYLMTAREPHNHGILTELKESARLTPTCPRSPPSTFRCCFGRRKSAQYSV